jgi:hypothetical protein
MEAKHLRLCLHSHRIDEFATGYSSAGCTPAEPASASPAGYIFFQPAGTCKPSPLQGGGIFVQQNEEFSASIDKVAIFKEDAETGDDDLVEGEARLGTIPLDEFIDGVPITAL